MNVAEELRLLTKQAYEKYREHCIANSKSEYNALKYPEWEELSMNQVAGWMKAIDFALMQHELDKRPPGM